MNWEDAQEAWLNAQEWLPQRIYYSRVFKTQTTENWAIDNITYAHDGDYSIEYQIYMIIRMVNDEVRTRAAWRKWNPVDNAYVLTGNAYTENSRTREELTVNLAKVIASVQFEISTDRYCL